MLKNLKALRGLVQVCTQLTVIHDCVESLNVLAEKEEEKKDEKKKLRERRQVDAEAVLYISCCIFVTMNKAGLTNHTR